MASLSKIGLIFLVWNVICDALAQPAEWQSRGMGGGGALFSPSISPHNEQEIFIACDMTDLFHSTTAGRNWEIVHFEEIRSLPDTKVQFTSDPNILYAINYDFPRDLRVPAKSTDGGATWSVLPIDPTFGEAYYLFADINHTDRLIASSYDQIYYSDDGGNSFNPIYSNNANEGAYVGGAFWDGPEIYIAVARGVLVSSNNGSSFSLRSFAGISENEGIVSFSASKQSGMLRFYCVTMNIQDIYPTVTGAEHWGFSNCYVLDFSGSQVWSAKRTGLGASDHPFYVVASPEDINTAYLGGGNGDSYYPIIFKTEDGGNNWNEVFRAVNNENIITSWSGYQGDTDWWYGEYVLGLAIAPSNPDVVVFTDLGYAHLSLNGGTTWKQIYSDPSTEHQSGAPTPRGRDYQSVGLENTSCWWLSWLDSENLFASFTDVTGIRSEDGGESWSRDYRNLDYNSVYQTVQHPTNGMLYAAVSTVHDIYQSTYLQDEDFEGGDGGIMWSADGGRNWQMLHDFNHPVVWQALDPNDINTLYACVVDRTRGGIYRTTNLQDGAAAIWSKLIDPPRTEGHPSSIQILKDGTLVSTYSGRRDNEGTFTTSSGVFVSTDAGASWMDRSDPGMQYWTRDLTIDPHDNDQDTWYVGVFSGWGGAPNGLGGTYKTTDRGMNWNRINDLHRVESCAIHPEDPNIMYVTTEAEGLWYTDNLSSSDPSFRLIPSYPFQHPVRVFFDPFDADDIWVTSFGNGLRLGRTNTTTASKEGDQSLLGLEVSLYPNPTRSLIQLKLNQHLAHEVQVNIFNNLGLPIQHHSTSVDFLEDAYLQVFDLSNLPLGTYYFEIRIGMHRILEKVSLLK